VKAGGARGFGEGCVFRFLLYAYDVVCIDICYAPFREAKSTERGLEQRFREKLLSCWPALKGSLAEVAKPAPVHLSGLRRGDKHRNYCWRSAQKGAAVVFTCQGHGARTQTRPEQRAPLERLLYAMGPALLQEYRAKNPAQTGPQRGRPAGHRNQNPSGIGRPAASEGVFADVNIRRNNRGGKMPAGAGETPNATRIWCWSFRFSCGFAS